MNPSLMQLLFCQVWNSNVLLIKQATNDRYQALMEAKQYRDLSETLKKEKRDIEHKLVSKIEIVRDFWRNKIVEGDSRGGKILRASLLRNK